MAASCAAAQLDRQAAQFATGAAIANSRKIAGLIGPTLVAMLVSEFPLVQPHLYDSQIPPVVYLSGVLMFAASQYRQATAGASSTVLMAFEGALLIAALVITYHGYRRGPG